jgi:hypothetical protein
LYFDKTFADKHRVNVTGLYSFQKDHSQRTGFNGLGIPADDMQNTNFTLVDQLTAAPNAAGNPQNYFAERGLISYMARLNYAFADRYLLTASIRRDGALCCRREPVVHLSCSCPWLEHSQ